jgi:hypothetical protein
MDTKEPKEEDKQWKALFKRHDNLDEENLKVEERLRIVKAEYADQGVNMGNLKQCCDNLRQQLLVA